MAEYRDLHPEIRAAGATVAAVSVDPEERSEALRRALDLAFPILSDIQRRVVQEWDLYNPRERGGIAKPATFVVERDRRIAYATVDSVATRVPAREILSVLRRTAEQRTLRRKVYLPRFADWFRALRAGKRR